MQGHTARVLHMAVSPDGETVVSGAADETLRFWKAFAPPYVPFIIHRVGSVRLVSRKKKADVSATSSPLLFSSLRWIRFAVLQEGKNKRMLSGCVCGVRREKKTKAESSSFGSKGKTSMSTIR